MPMSTNINTYADVAAVLEEVLPVGRGEYTLPTPGQAKHWAQRAYKYRLLLQKQVAAQNPVKGYTPPTPLDRMKLVVTGTRVAIDMNPQVTGRLSLPGGRVVTPPVKDMAPQAKPKVEMPFAAPLDFSNLAEAAAALVAEQSDED